VLTFVSAARRIPHADPERGFQRRTQIYLRVQPLGLDGCRAGERSRRAATAASSGVV